MLSRTLASLAVRGSVLAQPSRGSHYRNHYRPNPAATFAEKDIVADDPRRFTAIAPAAKWQSVTSNWNPVVAKFIGVMMRGGKREKAREILRQTFEEIKSIQLKKRRLLPEEQRNSIDVSPNVILNKAVENCTPVLELTPLIKSGLIYMVPRPPVLTLAQHRAMRFIIDSAQEKTSDVAFFKSLARELLYASQNEGKAIRKKVELYTKCEENRAFAAYRNC